MNNSEIKEKLISMTDKISELRKDNLINMDLICQYEKEIDDIELPIKVKVDTEYETTKDKNLSTIEKREKEVQKRLNENEQYKDKIRKIKQLKRTNAENDIIISYNRRVINIHIAFARGE